MHNNKIKLRIFIDFSFRFFVIVFSIITISPLILILFYVAKEGIRVINLEFFTNLPAPVGEPGGGISNALIGTLMLIILAGIFSVPIGMLVGIYLSENKEGKFANLIRVLTDVFQGIPSIVIGILAFLWVVKPVGKFSALSGGVALALIMLPVVIKSTEETLLMIPFSLKEASLSLGVPYYKTLLKVVIPSGLSGILTGILLGIARIAGETAPLLFTAFGNPFMNLDITKPINSLPLLIFNYSKSPFNEWHRIAWGASFVLIVLVLFLNLIARFFGKKWKVLF